MSKNSEQERSGWFLAKLGTVIFVVGSGPLLVTIALAKLGVTSDPNPNPVGFGIMAMFTFWPGLAMVGVGIRRVVNARRDGGQSSG